MRGSTVYIYIAAAFESSEPLHLLRLNGRVGAIPTDSIVCEKLILPFSKDTFEISTFLLWATCISPCAMVKEFITISVVFKKN